MRVIDVDSHFHEPIHWLKEADPVLASKLPMLSDLDVYLDITVGDSFSGLAAQDRLEPLSLAPPSLRDWMEKRSAPAAAASAATGNERIALERAGYIARDRVRWLDERGIEAQVVSPTVGYFAYRSASRMDDPRVTFRLLEAYNRWAADQLYGFTHRLIPTMMLDLADAQWSVRELRRMRDHGSRVALIAPEPASNKSLTHLDFEPVWSTAAELGVVILFHVGSGRAAIHPGWSNNGGDAAQFIRLSRLVRRQLPELALASLVFGGVLERHPGLCVLVSELGIEWLPSFLARIDQLVDHPAEAGLVSHPYDLPLKPSEYIQRQVRVSVVPQYDDVAETLRHVPPGIVVFASDFPHPEGSQEAVRRYESELQLYPAATREAFFGVAAAGALRL